MKQGILEANPEASFYPELRKMSQVSAPGVERALGDAVSRLNAARAGYDIQSVKQFQMATAMCGYRLNNGDWTNPSERDRVFEPFGLDSYKRGDLDMVILGRPVVAATEAERLDLVAQRETLRYQDSFETLGMEETKAEELIRKREEAELRRADIV